MGRHNRHESVPSPDQQSVPETGVENGWVYEELTRGGEYRIPGIDEGVEVSIYLGGTEVAKSSENEDDPRRIRIIDLKDLPRNDDGHIMYENHRLDPELQYLLVQGDIDWDDAEHSRYKGLRAGETVSIGHDDPKTSERFELPATVSGEHCTITIDPDTGEIVIVDKDSASGTTVEAFMGTPEPVVEADTGDGVEPTSAPVSSQPDDPNAFTQPPATPVEQSASPTPEELEAQRLIELDIRNNYEAAKESLANLSARDGMRWFRKNNPEEMTAAHDRFTRSIQEMMQIDPEGKAILTNPNLPPERRASLINSFYLEKHAELRKATTDAMANTTVGKASEFVRKHKKMVALGAIGLGIVTGGLGGVVVGGALGLGINKAAKHEQKGREKLAAGKFNIDELNQFTQENGGLSVGMDYFGLIARNMQRQMERDVIQAHRKRLVGAVAVGTAWGVGTYVGGQYLVGGLESAVNHVTNFSFGPPQGVMIKHYYG